MITQEHLNHWISEIKWQLNGILSEINPAKVQMSGINVGKNGEAFVSFTYLDEKATTIRNILRSIESDMIHDEVDKK